MREKRNGAYKDCFYLKGKMGTLVFNWPIKLVHEFDAYIGITASKVYVKFR